MIKQVQKAAGRVQATSISWHPEHRGHASFYFWTLETVTVSPHSSVTRNKTQITPATLRNPSPRPHSILASAIKIPGVTHLRGKGEARLTAPISRCVLVLLTNRLSLCMSVAFPARIQSRMVVKKKKKVAWSQKSLVTLPWPPTLSHITPSQACQN